MVNLLSAFVKSFRGFDLDDSLAYDTNKVVRIRDRRLGLLYYLFWLGILAYVIISLFYFNQFLETETPVGTATLWGEETDPYLATTDAEPYCNNLDYDFEYLPTWIAHNVSCQPSAIRSVWRAITTTERHVATVEYVTDNNIASTYYPYNFKYLAGVEHIKVVIEHSLATSERNEKNIACNVLDHQGGVAFRTRDKQAVQLTITELLALAGTGLDQKQVVGSGTDPTADAYVRLTGAIIHVEFTYENYEEAFDTNGQDIACTLQFKQLAGQWGVLDQQVEGNVIVSRLGLQFIVFTKGKIGRFSIVAVLTTLVSAMVLFKIATTVVDFIAVHLLKHRYSYRVAKWNWTEDFNDEEGMDEYDIEAENYIPVTRRDIRATMDNLLLKLRAAGVAVNMNTSQDKGTTRIIQRPKRCCRFNCKTSQRHMRLQHSRMRPPPVSSLVAWDDIVAENGTAAWGDYQANTNNLCNRASNAMQEAMGLENRPNKLNAHALVARIGVRRSLDMEAPTSVSDKRVVHVAPRSRLPPAAKAQEVRGPVRAPEQEGKHPQVSLSHGYHDHHNGHHHAAPHEGLVAHPGPGPHAPGYDRHLHRPPSIAQVVPLSQGSEDDIDRENAQWQQGNYLNTLIHGQYLNAIAAINGLLVQNFSRTFVEHVVTQAAHRRQAMPAVAS